MKRLLKNRRGQSLVEYALILSLIAVVCIPVLKGIGQNTKSTLEKVYVALQ